MKYSKWMTLPLALSMLTTVTVNSNVLDGQVSVFAQETAPDAHAETVLEELKTLFPDEDFPTYLLMNDLPPYLAATTTTPSDQENFNVLFYAEDEAFSVNDQALNERTPIASYSRTTYGSEDEAIHAVNQMIDLQGEEVDLGYGITGYYQGAAGSTYLNWQEGNWGIVVKSNNIENEDPLPLAQAIVEHLEAVRLPAPSVAGQMTLKNTSGGASDENTIIWQEGNVVYEVTHFDPLQAVKMTGSISEPTEQ
ncbi:hypothetical protein [Facklamia lactis]|uniref:hypothetical protein n=1 Tax=Facklamia lactis TaxID=2749967 RepID=UPI0018CEB474|nr:hypothetical protein [Facklamia lactis]MBG9981054.1 hypothetical protein [Facklamia lactis]